MNKVLEEQNMIRPIETIISSPKIRVVRKTINKRKRCVTGKHRNNKTNRCNKHKGYKK